MRVRSSLILVALAAALLLALLQPTHASAAGINITYYTSSTCAAGTVSGEPDMFTAALGSCQPLGEGASYQMFVSPDGAFVQWVEYEDTTCMEWSRVYQDPAGEGNCVAQTTRVGLYQQITGVPSANERGPAPPFATWPVPNGAEGFVCATADCSGSSCRSYVVERLDRPCSTYRCSGGGQRILLQLSRAEGDTTCANTVAVWAYPAAPTPTPYMCSDRVGVEGTYLVCPTSVTAAAGPPADAASFVIARAVASGSSSCAVSDIQAVEFFRNATCFDGGRWLSNGTLATRYASFEDPSTCGGEVGDVEPHPTGQCTPQAEGEDKETYVTKQSANAADMPWSCALGWLPASSPLCSTSDSSSSSTAAGQDGAASGTASVSFVALAVLLLASRLVAQA